MISPKFEDRLDEVLRHWAGPWSESAILEKLTSDEREWVAKSPQAKQLLSDWIWVHRHAGLLNPPTVPEGFSERVLARSRESRPLMGLASGRRFARQPLVWASAAVALAAAVLLAVLIGPSTDAPFGDPNVVAIADPNHDQDAGSFNGVGGTDVRDWVAHGEGPISDRSPHGPPERSVADRTSDESTMVAMLDGDSRPQLRRAIVESTGSIMDTGRELQHRIEPVTNSAMGAFDFLWRSQPESSPEKKPST